MKNKLILSLSILLSLSSQALSESISTYRSRGEIVKRIYKSFGQYTVVKFGVFDLKTKSLKVKGFNLIQKYQEDNLKCLDSIINSATLNQTQLDDFAKFVEFNDRFFQTKYGVLVEKGCLEKATKSYIEKNILKSYKDGVSCLQKLGGAGSDKLLSKMNTLFSDPENKPKIYCSETNEDLKEKGINWDSAKAYASASSDFDSGDMKHPFISLGQKWRWQENPYSFQGTLFHEFIHNTGCVHTETVEKSYTCQTCCFSELDNPNVMMGPAQSAIEQKDVACKICKSDYEGITDQNYLRDFAKYSILGGRVEFLLPTLKNYMKERPGDDFAIEVFIDVDQGGPLAKALKSKHESGMYGLLAAVIKSYAKGDYVESASFIRRLKEEKHNFSEESYSSIYDDIEKDLLFMSFANPAIKVNVDNPLKDLFKQSSGFISSPITLN